MDDWELYKQINEDVFAKYREDKDSFDLLSIKTFLDNINNKKNIKNKKYARKEFTNVMKNVKSEDLKNIIKELEQTIFGNDDSNGESSKGSKVKTFAPSRPQKEHYFAETNGYLKYIEEQEKDRKKFSDEHDSNGWPSSGSGLKILTNKQMFSRLPILLAQIQAGNNSTKLKNELRQLIYSLYRSKKLTKTVYNNLIKAIRV